MKTSVPTIFSRTGLLLLAVLSLHVSIAQSGSGGGSGSDDDIDEIPELIFRNATLLSGTDGKEGAVYLFPNVSNGFDATIRLKKFSNPDIYMRTIDNTSFGWEKAFQPEFGMSPVRANQNWYIDFELTFLEAGTTKRKKADRFTVTSIDVDGDGVNVKEYVVMEKASSVTYSPVSYLSNGNAAALHPTCCECSKQSAVAACTKCSGTGKDPKDKRGKRKCGDCDGVGKIYSDCKHAYCGEDASVQGPVDNFVNIDTAGTAVMATYIYNNKDVINFRIGARSGQYDNYGAGIRLNSLWFRAFSLGAPITLPVQLTGFTATYEKADVRLNWTTTKEENFSHFVVEGSTDGKRYKDLAVVFSASADGFTDYSYKDKSVSSATGVLYYRLRSIDKTGDIGYSDVRVIKLHNKETKSLLLSTYPNPATDQLRITMPSGWQGKKVTVELFNSNGARVHTIPFSNANQTESIQVKNLLKGFYVMKATCNTEVAQQQLIKN